MAKKIIVIGSGFGGLAASLRLKAKGYLLTASLGTDPFEKLNHNTTIKEFCDLYIERHAKLKKKKQLAF